MCVCVCVCGRPGCARPCYNTVAPPARRLKGPTAAPASMLDASPSPRRARPPPERARYTQSGELDGTLCKTARIIDPKLFSWRSLARILTSLQARRQEQSSYSRDHHTHAHHAPAACTGPPPPNGTRSHSPQAAHVTCQSNVPLACG